MTTLTLKAGRRKISVERPRVVGQPLMVSYGMGTDSTAMLVLLHQWGIRPDIILFADTGSEKPETYAYIAIIQAWLALVGFPAVTIVKNNSKLYDSLYANCDVNSTLPSLAFGMKGCSQKWKVQVMNTWTNSWTPALLAWNAGLKCLKLIGYDAGPADCRRSKIAEDDHYSYAYPLREAGIKREQCEAIITAAGLPLPGKSACFMCPAMKRYEIVALGEKNPELLAKALFIEAKAEAFPGSNTRGPGFSSTKGLGRNWNWWDYLEKEQPALFTKLINNHNCGQSYRTDALKNRAALAERNSATHDEEEVTP